MLKKTNLILALTLGLNFSWSYQSEAQHIGGTYNLQEVLKLGLENNYDLESTRLDEEAAAFQRKEIIGSGLPQLKAYGNYNNFLEVTPMGLPGGFFDPNTDP